MAVPIHHALPGSSRLQAMAHRRLQVGEHVLDIGSLRFISLPDGPRLTPKSAAVLLELACKPGQTLSRVELMDAVWAGTCPTPDVLTQAITDLRRVLGDESQAPRFIETVPKIGYRLLAPVSFLDADGDDATATYPAQVPALALALDGRGSAGVVAQSRVVVRVLGAIALIALIGAVFASALDPLRSLFDRSAAPNWSAWDTRTLTSEPGAEKYPRISPDGTRIAYSASDASQRQFRLLVRSLEQARPLRLGINEDGEEFYPVWSPDGASIAFLRYSIAGCKVILTPAMGGQERMLRPCFNEEVNYFAWSPDGSQLITTNYSDETAGGLAIALLALAGGDSRVLEYSHAAWDKDIDARYSPDGRWIAFRRGARPYTDLWMIPASGGDAQRLTRFASRVRGYDWTRDSKALVFSSNHEGHQALYTVDIADAQVRALNVEPAENPSTSTTTDSIVYEIPRVRTQLGEVRLSEGLATRNDILATTANDSAPAISPVDARLLFVSDRSGSQQLWLHDPATANVYPLTDYANATLIDPAWRADGSRVLVTVRGVAGASGLVEIDLASRTERLLTGADDDVRYGTYGAQPNQYLVVVADGNGEVDLLALDSPGRPASTRRTLVKGVGRAEADPVSGAIYFTRLSGRGLFRLDTQTGVERLVTVATPRFYVDGWRIVSGNVVYVSINADASGELRSLDPATGYDWVLVTMPALPAGLDFSVSAAGDRIVLARVASDDTDIGAFKLRHAPE